MNTILSYTPMASMCQLDFLISNHQSVLTNENASHGFYFRWESYRQGLHTPAAQLKVALRSSIHHKKSRNQSALKLDHSDGSATFKKMIFLGMRPSPHNNP